LGVIVSKILTKDFHEVIPTAGYRGRGFSSGQGQKKFVLRRATVEERAGLMTKVRDEEKALAVRIGSRSFLLSVITRQTS
jgi:hypothetical protein